MTGARCLVGAFVVEAILSPLGCMRALEGGRASASAIPASDSARSIEEASLGGLRWKFESPARAPAGAPIRFRFVLQNTRAYTNYMRFGGGSGYIDYGDVVVTDVHGNEVWTRIGSDVMFERAIVTVPIPPGDSLIAVHLWDQKDRYGGTVTKGTYVVRGYVHPRRSGMPIVECQKPLIIE